MATNEILPFAQGAGANVQTQAEYAAEPLRDSGNVAGIARSNVNNKALRQSSLMASALAQYIADNQSNNITDTASTASLAAWLGDALRGGLGVTAPQFDNDTSLATTAFVQRALGNYRTVTELSSATTLTAAAAGGFYSLFGAGSFAVTIPLGSTVPVGTKMAFFCTAAPGQVFVQRQGADQITMSGTSIVNGVDLYSGDTLYVTWTGTSWAAEGSVQAKYQPGFAASLATNGYQKLPSGLIIQWGVITTSGSGAASFNWPIAFPNSSLAAVITGTVTGGSIYVSSIFSRSLTGFSASTRNNAGAFTAEVCSYISIGN